MINIQYSSLLVVVSINLFFLIIYQIPNSYSQLYSNENFANMDEKQGESKETFSNNNNNNNNENYFDNGSDNLKTDNLNDKNSYLYSDKISNQESISKKEDNVNNINNFNLKDYAQSIKQLYKKQTNNQELDSDKSLYYTQNNDSNNTNNIKDDLNQSFEVKKLLKDQKYSYKDFSKEVEIDNNNEEYKEEDIPYSSSSVNDNDLNNKNNDDGYDSYNQQSDFESSSASKS